MWEPRANVYNYGIIIKQRSCAQILADRLAACPNDIPFSKPTRWVWDDHRHVTAVAVDQSVKEVRRCETERTNYVWLSWGPGMEAVRWPPIWLRGATM